MATKKGSGKAKATKKKSGSRTASSRLSLKAAGGSPIIIDGGSVILDFVHGEFNQTGNQHKHTNPAAGIRDVRVTGAVTGSIPINGQKVRITIRLQ